VSRIVVLRVGVPVPKTARRADRRGAIGGWVVVGGVEIGGIGVLGDVTSGCRGGSAFDCRARCSVPQLVGPAPEVADHGVFN
jgi:hypothetical protein